jgi:hypothetical protein
MAEDGRGVQRRLEREPAMTILLQLPTPRHISGLPNRPFECGREKMIGLPLLAPSRFRLGRVVALAYGFRLEIQAISLALCPSIPALEP